MKKKSHLLLPTDFPVIFPHGQKKNGTDKKNHIFFPQWFSHDFPKWTKKKRNGQKKITFSFIIDFPMIFLNGQKKNGTDKKKLKFFSSLIFPWFSQMDKKKNGTDKKKQDCQSFQVSSPSQSMIWTKKNEHPMLWWGLLEFWTLTTNWRIMKFPIFSFFYHIVETKSLKQIIDQKYEMIYPWVNTFTLLNSFLDKLCVLTCIYWQNWLYLQRMISRGWEPSNSITKSFLCIPQNKNLYEIIKTL